MSDAQLYEDSYTITSLVDGPYERVIRLLATSADNNTTLTLDINSELYPLSSGESFSLLAASTLNLDGTKDDVAGRGWRQRRAGEQTLADLWDYVCYGKVYRHEAVEGSDKIKVYVSFGGLLACFEGPYKKLSPLRIENVYLLLKK